MKRLEEGVEPLTNAAALYLSTLTTLPSRRGMQSPLNHAAKYINPKLTGTDAWKNVDWNVLSAPLIRAILAAMPGSPSTKRKALAALKGTARSAWEMGFLDAEAYQRIRGIKGPRGSGEIAGRHIPDEEIDALIKICTSDPAASGRRDAALIGIARAGGARRAELGALRMGDVHEENGRLRLNIRGKGNKSRFVYIEAPPVLQALKAWMALRQSEPNAALFSCIRKGGFITAESLSTAALDKILVKRVAQAGLSNLTWHDFRRTAADNLLDAGVDVFTVSKILGHSNVQTTAGYDRRDERAKIRAAGLLATPGA